MIRILIILFITNTSYAQIKAFPEAEGFGANVTGGRGGDVLIVSALKVFRVRLMRIS